MFNLGGAELVVIALIALIVLGPSRLPDAARTVGKAMSEVRKLSSGFQEEVRTAFEDVDAKAKPADRRRTEATPLAAAVDEVDRISPADDLPAPAADDVAPEVADALDEVVRPPEAPAAEAAAGPPADADADTGTAPETGAGTGEGEGEAPGDHRAAS